MNSAILHFSAWTSFVDERKMMMTLTWCMPFSLGCTSTTRNASH